MVGDFRHAAQNAKDAGFDGIELHGAFGYLPNQFLVDASNHRQDEYGGTIENRCRFVIEVMQALVSVWGPSRVGIKLSPTIPYNGMTDSDPLSVFGHLDVYKRQHRSRSREAAWPAPWETASTAPVFVPARCHQTAISEAAAPPPWTPRQTVTPA